MRYIGIGWDVGGWMGNGNAFAVASWDSEAKRLDWMMEPSCILIPRNKEFSLEYVLNGLRTDDILSSNVVIGVDSPLGFPRDFARLVGGQDGIDRSPERMIDNTLAYRITEQWVCSRFRRIPLSAPFDKLGNNATLAISTVRRWSLQHKFSVLPFAEDNGHRVIIEVYPGLLSLEAFDGIRESICGNIPEGVQTRTHQYDACLAALNALALRATEGNMTLPHLSYPQSEHADAVNKEGWIYCFSTQ